MYLQTILHQFSHSLNTCKQESLLKVGSTFPEMAAQEKIVDGFVELVKRDQLDENVPTDALERCVGYFYTMYPVLFVTDGKQNHTQLLNDSTKTLLSACDGMQIDALAMKNLIESRNTEDMELLSQYIVTTVDQLQQQLKLIKRRIPPDTTVSNLGLNKEVFENLYHCYGQAGKVLRMLQDIIKNTVQVLNTTGGKIVLIC